MAFRISILVITSLIIILFTKAWFAAALFLLFIFYNLYLSFINQNSEIIQDIDARINLSKQKENFSVINKLFRPKGALNLLLKRWSIASDKYKYTSLWESEFADISTSPRYSDMPGNIYYRQK